MLWISLSEVQFTTDSAINWFSYRYRGVKKSKWGPNDYTDKINYTLKCSRRALGARGVGCMLNYFDWSHYDLILMCFDKIESFYECLIA